MSIYILTSYTKMLWNGGRRTYKYLEIVSITMVDICPPILHSFTDQWNWPNVQPQVMVMDDGHPRYICPRCGVKYKKISGLRGHLKECGTGAQCPICPKIVTQRRNLRKHMEKHKREALLTVTKDIGIDKSDISSDNNILLQTLPFLSYEWIFWTCAFHPILALFVIIL